MIKIGDRVFGQLIGLLTLSVGITIGFYFGREYRPIQRVEAQAILPPTPTFTDITPNVTTNTFGTNLLMAHEIAADSLVINGFDVMKLQQNTLNYLASQPLAERASIENLINASRATTIYRLKQNQPPAINSNPEKK